MKNPSKDSLNVLIVDDHWSVRDGVKFLLKNREKIFHIEISEAENGKQAIDQVAKHDIDLVILDYQLPDMDGAEVAQRILAIKPGIKILALSNYNEVSNIEKMTAAGVHGYVLKDTSARDFLTAMETVIKGQFYYSNQVSAKLFEERRREMQKITLSTREMEVLTLLAEGNTSSDIALQLSLGKSTIDSHRKHLLTKFDVQNTTSLLKAAHEKGFLP